MIENFSKEIRIYETLVDPKFVPVLNRELFTKYERFIQFIENFDIGENVDCREERNFIVKTILIHKYQAICLICLELIIETNANPSPAYLLNNGMTAIKNIIKLYEINIYNDFIEHYGNDGPDVYNIVYLGEKGFKKMHEDRINFLIEDLTMQAEDNYWTIEFKLSNFIGGCTLAFRHSFHHITKIIRDLNGGLSKIISKIETFKKPGKQKEEDRMRIYLDLISENKPAEALEALINWTANDVEMYKKIVFFKRQLAEINDMKNAGITDEKFFILRMSQITDGLINLISELKI